MLVRSLIRYKILSLLKLSIVQRVYILYENKGLTFILVIKVYLALHELGHLGYDMYSVLKLRLHIQSSLDHSH